MASISEVGRQSQQMNFRAPEGMPERIKEAALKNGRSLNAEIVHRLESSFSASVELSPALAEIINKHIETEVTARLKAIAAQLAGGNNV